MRIPVVLTGLCSLSVWSLCYESEASHNLTAGVFDLLGSPAFGVTAVITLILGFVGTTNSASGTDDTESKRFNNRN